MKRAEAIKRSFAELVGTYLLVVVGPGTIVLLSLASITGASALVIVAIAFGGVVGLDILFLGTFSGALVNPAVTIAVALAGVIDRRLVVPYITLQSAGALLAGLTLRVIFGSGGDSTSLGSTKLASGVSPVYGFALEAMGTLALASSALIASTKINGAKRQALLVGTTLAFLILLVGPFTGAGFNPARSLGPSLAAGYFSNLYLYIFGPTTGALIAGTILWLTKSDR